MIIFNDMTITTLATELYLDIGSPTYTSIPAIAYFLRGKIGLLNVMLYEEFSVDESSLEVVNSDGSALSTNAAAVLKQMYRIYDLEVLTRSTLNAAATDSIISVTDNLAGTSFQRHNKNEISKTYSSLRKDEIKALQDMVASYRILNAKPSQIAGDDTISSSWGNVYTYRPFVTRVGPYGT